MTEKVARLMEGAYDTHMHATPCMPARRQTLLEAAQTARDMGMKGIVVKDHHYSTAQMASIVNEALPDFKVIGGITLSSACGGINPDAVEANFKLGGRVVWMFCLESAWMIQKITTPGFGALDMYKKLGVKPEKGGYDIFVNGEGSVLKPEVRDIIALAKQYDGVLETSHLSAVEGRIFLKEALAQGVKRLVVTHANQEVTYYEPELQKELAAHGVKMQYCMAQYMPKPGEPPEDIRGLAKLVRTVGAENILLGTDFGQWIWPPAAEGMRMMIAQLLNMGISEEEITLMAKTNPAEIYG